MAGITELLMEEQKRLQKNLFTAKKQLRLSFIREIARANEGLSQKSYIDVNELSLEKRILLRENCRIIEECEAKLDVFNNFIKSGMMQPVDYSKNFSRTIISCDCLNILDNGDISGPGIFVAGYIVDSLSEMSYQQYSALYINSLNMLLSKLLGNSMSEPEKRELLKVSCLEVYSKRNRVKSM